MQNALTDRIIRKLKAGRLVYGILSACIPDKAVTVTDDTVQRSLALLESYHPDGGSSCLISNRINPNPTCDLTILIPAYNVERYVEECLNSIFSQQTTYSYRVKVIDDGSTDNTWSKLQRYRERPDIELIRKENGGGLGGALNVGLNEIDSRYVMCVDADDALMPDAIQCMLDAICANDDVDIVEGQNEHFDGMRVLERSRAEKLITDDWTVLSGFITRKVYRSFLFDGMGIPERYWFEDTVGHVVRFCHARKVMIIPNLVYRYRQNPEGICSSAQKNYKALDTFWVTKRLMQDRVKLNKPFTQRDYGIFLAQVAHDIYRLSWMGEDVIRALTVLYIDMRRTYFPTCKAKDRKGKVVEKLLDAGRIKHLALFCRYVYFL